MRQMRDTPMTTTQPAGAQSPTPRTEGLLAYLATGVYPEHIPHSWVEPLVEHARTLERELSAAHAALADLKHDIERSVAANAELATALAAAQKESAINMENFKVTNRAYVDMDERRLKAEAALAEAQRQIRTIRHDCLAPAFELTARLCAIRVVAEKDDYELIRRESVMDFVVRWRQTIDKLPPLAGDEQETHVQRRGRQISRWLGLPENGRRCLC